MTDKVFVDSNIFIYAKIKSQDTEKHIGAQSLLRSLDRWSDFTGDMKNKLIYRLHMTRGCKETFK